MKTHKEKAKELVEIFGKELAIKCVDEIIDSYNLANVEYEDGQFNKYWQDIKSEIEKLK